MDQVLDRVIATTVDLLRCDSAAVFRYDQAREGLVPVRDVNLPPTMRDVVIRPGEGITGRAFEGRAPVWVTTYGVLAGGFALDLDRVLGVIVEKARDLLACDAAVVYGVDEAGERLAALRGLNVDPALITGFALRVGEGLAGRAFAERRPLWSRDLRTDRGLTYSSGDTERLVKTKAMRAPLAVPIISRGTAYGALVAGFYSPHEFTEKEIRLLSATRSSHTSTPWPTSRPPRWPSRWTCSSHRCSMPSRRSGTVLTSSAARWNSSTEGLARPFPL